MLVLTSHARDRREDNVRWFGEQLGINPDQFVKRSFDTSTWPGSDSPMEFVLIGFMVQPTHHSLAP
jgi:hypothetical protein